MRKFLATILAICILATPAMSQGWFPLTEPSITSVSNACSTSSGTTITFTAQATGGANPNRITVVSINWDDSTNAGTAQLTTMTIGGISMTKAIAASASAGNSNSEIWYAINPSGTTANIVTTFATAVNGITIEVYSLIGYVATPSASIVGTTSVSQAYNNKQVALAAASRTINVSTSLSNMVNDFSSACGANLWGVHASQVLRGNNQTLTSTISPTSNNPQIALVVWGTTPVIVADCTISNLTGVLGHWDASNFASLSLTGSTVNSIADLSGNSYTLTPFGSGVVVYQATGLNSKPTMAFGTVTGGGLKNSSVALGTGNTLTVFAIINMDPTAGAAARIISYFNGSGGGSNDANNNQSFLLAHSTVLANDAFLYRNTNTASGTINTATNRRVIATINSSGVMTIYVDGVATTLATLNANFGSPGPFAIGIEADAASSGWNGLISEVGITNTFTNSTNVGLLDTCLKTKWGL